MKYKYMILLYNRIMSTITTSREMKIVENINRILGNSPQAQEIKSIVLKAALGQMTEEDKIKYWEEKQRDLEEIKERMPVANDLALPVESITIVGEPLLSNTILGESSQYIVNGTADVSGQGETSRGENLAIKHKIFFGYTA
jgi:hypothetical protein